MIHLTRSLVRRQLSTLLHVDDTPERTAAAFALGVFFGFSPLLGLHTVLGIIAAFLFNLNRVAVLLGVYANLPWFLAPYYAVATMAGAELTGHRPPPEFRTQVEQLFELSLWQADFWARLLTLMRPLVWPYAVGSTLFALVLAAAAYQAALVFVTNRRIQRMMHRRSEGTISGE
jgi:uncharacterized protein (DUF2062 family)